jgi:mono/diheme cytochrome c family protein
MTLAIRKFSWQFLTSAMMVCLALLALGSVHQARAEGDDDRHGMVNDMDLPTGAEQLQNGKDRYQARCSYCHRPDGRGGSSGVSLASQKYKWGSKASDIYSTISAGRKNTKMGAFGNPETGLTTDEIFNIIAYIRTLQESKLADDKAAPKTQ